jgi:hypothetical protein
LLAFEDGGKASHHLALRLHAALAPLDGIVGRSPSQSDTEGHNESSTRCQLEQFSGHHVRAPLLLRLSSEKGSPHGFLRQDRFGASITISCLPWLEKFSAAAMNAR